MRCCVVTDGGFITQQPTVQIEVCGGVQLVSGVMGHSLPHSFTLSTAAISKSSERENEIPTAFELDKSGDSTLLCSCDPNSDRISDTVTLEARGEHSTSPSGQPANPRIPLGRIRLATTNLGASFAPIRSLGGGNQRACRIGTLPDSTGSD